MRRLTVVQVLWLVSLLSVAACGLPRAAAALALSVATVEPAVRSQHAVIASTAQRAGGTVQTMGAAFWRNLYAQPAVPGPSPYGPISDMPDENGLRLPAGFTSRVVAITGQLVPNTLLPWHPLPDGGANGHPGRASTSEGDVV